MWSCWSQDVNTLGCAKSISLTGINWCLVLLKPIFRCQKVPTLYRKYTSEIITIHGVAYWYSHIATLCQKSSSSSSSSSKLPILASMYLLAAIISGGQAKFSRGMSANLKNFIDDQVVRWERWLCCADCEYDTYKRISVNRNMSANLEMIINI